LIVVHIPSYSWHKILLTRLASLLANLFFCEVDVLFLQQSLFLKESPTVAKAKTLTTSPGARDASHALHPQSQNHVVTPGAFRLFRGTLSFMHMQMRCRWLQSKAQTSLRILSAMCQT